MSGATGMKLQKEKFISYQEYMKRKQGIKFYNLGVAAQYQNTPNYPVAAKYYQMTLLVNPFDVDAKSALQKISSPPINLPINPGKDINVSEDISKKNKPSENLSLYGRTYLNILNALFKPSFVTLVFTSAILSTKVAIESL